MKPKKVKRGLFMDRVNGVVVFDILGKKASYTGVLERIAVDNTYVPKLHIHEKSSWMLIGVRPWFDRYTLYYGDYKKTEEEARAFLSEAEDKLQKGISIEDIVQNGFQDAVMYWE